MVGEEFSKIFSAMSSQDLTQDKLLEALERVRQKLLLAETSAAAMAQVDQLRESFEDAIVRTDDISWLAKHLLHEPVGDQDRNLLKDLLPVVAYVRLTYICSQIVSGFEKHEMPYDSAVLEARNVLEALQSKGALGLEEFFEQNHAASALRTLHAYVESNSATSSFVRPWSELEKKAEILPIVASICELR